MVILLVEDTSVMRKVVASMLGKLGYDDIVEAGDGKTALEHLRLRHVDLVLTDWLMPEMDGGQLLRQIRNTPSFADLPVIVFTSLTGKEAIAEAGSAGADGFLSKPFSIAQLKRVMAQAMARRAKEQIRHVILGADPVRAAEKHALLVIGERAVTTDMLSRPDERDTLRYLSAVHAAIGAINARAEGNPEAGYTLEADGAGIARRVRGLPHRARALMLSTSLPASVTTARLLSINRPSELTLCIVCRRSDEVPREIRRSLEGMGVLFLERRRMDAEAIEKLLQEKGVVGIPAEESELPTPEELQQRLEQDIRNTADLPVLAQVFQKITILDHDPDSALQAWIDVIETDPLSSAQVIRRARSPAYGFQGEINQTDKAVILLGKNEVKQIVVSGAVKRSLDKVTEKGFSVDEYWIHSVAVAATARLLSFPLDEAKWSPGQKKAFEELQLEKAELEALREASLWSRFDLQEGQDPFIGGIMHDIGKVVLAHAYPGLFPAVLEELQSCQWQRPMAAIEGELTGGSDHAVVGHVLASDWDLGEATTAAVLQHHATHPSNVLARLVAIADYVAGALYPFPAEAKYPHVEILGQMLRSAASDEAEGAKTVMPEGLSIFLPDSVADEVKTSRGELLELTSQIAPAIRRLVQGIQNSV